MSLDLIKPGYDKLRIVETFLDTMINSVQEYQGSDDPNIMKDLFNLEVELRKIQNIQGSPNMKKVPIDPLHIEFYNEKQKECLEYIPKLYNYTSVTLDLKEPEELKNDFIVEIPWDNSKIRTPEPGENEEGKRILE